MTDVPPNAVPSSAEKRLLLIAYHFGPTGPVGGFRWFAFTRQLLEADWTVDVVVEEHATALTDAECREWQRTGKFTVAAIPARHPWEWLLRIPSLIRDRIWRRFHPRTSSPPVSGSAVSPAELPVWRPGTRLSSGSLLSRSLSGLREFLHFRRWSKDAGDAALRLACSRSYRALVVSTPPHFVQAAGAYVRRRVAIPFMADLRDPWMSGLESTVEYFDPVTRILGKWYERRLVRTADVLIHNTARAAAALRAHRDWSPLPRQVVIGNGYERVAHPGLPDRTVFRVLFGGSLYPFMDARVLFAALAQLRDRFELAPEVLRVEFLGTDEQYVGVSLRELAGSYGLAEYIEILPPRPRVEAVKRQAQAAVLVAFDFWHRTAVVMKFFDYAQLHGTMLLIGNPDSALADAARPLGCAVRARDDVNAIAGALEEAYAKWQRFDFPQSNDATGRYDRAERFRELMELFEKPMQGLHDREA